MSELDKHLPKARFVRAVLGTGGLGILQRGVGLVTAILLARFLGAEGYGYYAFAIAVTGLLAVPAQVGLPQLMTRELAANQALERWSLMRGLRRRAVQVAAVGIVVALFAGGLMLLNAGRIPSLEPTVFALALAMIPLMIIMEIASNVLRGLRHVVHATWPVAALKPLLTLALIVASYLTLKTLTPAQAMAMTVAGTIAAIIALAILEARFWPQEAKHDKPRYKTREWLRALLPFTVLGAANIIIQKTDIVMLGVLTGPQEVGIYNIAVQGAMLVSFGFAAMNVVLAPNISRFYVQQDMARLQRLLSVSSLVILAIAVCVMAVLVIFGVPLMEVIFGPQFARGYPALLVLGFGQLINASVGSVGTFLSMTRHEGDTVRAILVATVVNIVLNAVLIPIHGLMGAAIATMTSTIVWNVMMSVAVYRRLGLVPGPFLYRFKRSR